MPTKMSRRFRFACSAMTGIVLLMLHGCAAAQATSRGGAATPVQTALPQRPVWIDFSPPDAGGEHFLVGLSEVHASERDAREDAMRHAREQFAQYTGVEVSLVDEVVRSLYGSSSGVLDAEVAENSTARQSSDALVSRIKARQWYWEAYPAAAFGQGEGLAYRYWVLVSVPVDEFERVQEWKRQKERAQTERETARAEQLRQGLEAIAARRGAAGEITPETIAVAVTVQGAVSAMARQSGREAPLAAAVEALNGRLLAELHRSRAFQVVNSPAVPPRYRLLVDIDGFEDISEQTEYERIGRTSLTRSVFLSAVARIVETESGTLAAESSGEKMTRKQTVDLGRPGSRPPGNELLVDLAAAMARKLVRETAGTVRPARVLAVSGDQLLIDRGTEDGFRPGVLIELYASETLRAPGSGATYRNELAVGRAKVIRADDRQSFAAWVRPVAAPAEGLVARIVTPAGEEAPASSAPADAGEEQWLTPGSSDKPVNW